MDKLEQKLYVQMAIIVRDVTSGLIIVSSMAAIHQGSAKLGKDISHLFAPISIERTDESVLVRLGRAGRTSLPPILVSTPLHCLVYDDGQVGQCRLFE